MQDFFALRERTYKDVLYNAQRFAQTFCWKCLAKADTQGTLIRHFKARENVSHQNRFDRRNTGRIDVSVTQISTLHRVRVENPHRKHLEVDIFITGTPKKNFSIGTPRT